MMTLDTIDIRDLYALIGEQVVAVFQARQQLIAAHQEIATLKAAKKDEPTHAE